MGLNDIVGQLPGKLRRASVNDIESGSIQSVAGRLTAHTVLYPKVAADGAAADTADIAWFQTEGEIFSLTARIIPSAALTADASNYATVSVWDGTTTYWTKTTESESWVDNTPLALSPVPVDQSIADNVTLRFRIQKTGTGVVVPIMFLHMVIAEKIA